MIDARDAARLAGRPQEHLYRALRWACLGAVSGIVATIITILPRAFDWGLDVEWVGLAASGLSYGLIVGIALRRRRLANRAQIAFLAILSAGAWAISAYAYVFFFFRDSGPIQRPDLDTVFVAGLAVGLIWGTLQTACFALLFPFARRPFYWFFWVLAGSCTAGVLGLIVVEYFLDLLDIRGSLIDYDGWMMAVIVVVLGGPWTFWYAAYTAALSPAVPYRPTS